MTQKVVQEVIAEFSFENCYYFLFEEIKALS